MLPAELTWITGQAQHRPCWLSGQWSWDTRGCSRIPPASYRAQGERWKANTNFREGSEQDAVWGLCQSPRDGAGGTHLELYPLGRAGKGPLHACPSCCCWPWLLSCSAPTQHQRNQTAALTLFMSHPRGKAVRQTHPAPPTHPRQPLSHYLFKCSSRKRKVMRLGSGSERRRCIMQFSLAAGSERAGGKEGEGSGQGLVQQQDPPQPQLTV